MSEPLVIWRLSDGVQLIVYGAAQKAELLATGEYSEEEPKKASPAALPVASKTATTPAAKKKG